MNAATISALSTGIVAIVTAVGALLHSVQTRGQVNAHASQGVPPHQPGGQSPQLGGHA